VKKPIEYMAIVLACSRPISDAISRGSRKVKNTLFATPARIKEGQKIALRI
jgi:hypothetical protein